ncbi:TonB-dependent siderophore receptor [Synoicihabitans lomoniglobus]|uniref:TonB-dependent receptor plug domain-containing protein n=1 Tax=Synoicihabitans lomoniglobus TaxID=2909285 RepID=A0AAF0CNZ7_9BACT|nr:TonB-dependent receptor plug domain-containing protein [Opitutaceae bacterium LMO-M01]WED63154.1 TonB-dependent receptor plug domain-containing protein [Opitutaceae bacterium LMO-M01]
MTLKSPARRPQWWIVSPCLAVIAQLSLVAQSASVSSETDNSAVVELSEFVVTSDDDVGYAATSSLAGSRLKTDLKDIAAPISVFTKEFLDDIGATSVNAALEYALNTVTEYDVTGNGIVSNNYQTRMRGITGAGRSRNYMSTNLNIDFYNTERLDFSRGPNSVLFGIGSPAGIINSSTKFARLGGNLTTVQMRVGSYSDHRASIDINRSLTDSLAIRANLLWQDSEGYRDFEFQQKKGAALAGTWRPFEKTTIRIEGEVMDIEENRARPWTPFDGVIGWETAGRPGVNTATTWGGTASGTGSAITSGIVFMEDGLWAGQFVNQTGAQNFRWSNGATPNIPGLNTPPNVLDYSVVPRTSNIFGAGARSSSDSRAGGIYLEQKINEDLSFELAYATEYEERPVVAPMNFGSFRLRYDVNAYLPVFDAHGVQTGMQQNPNFGSPVMITNGGFGNNSHAWSSNYREELRATAAYHLDFRAMLDRESLLARVLGHHRLAALITEVGSERTAKNSRYVNIHETRANPNYFNNVNAIRWGNYYDPFAANPTDRGLHDPFGALESVGVQPLAHQPGRFVQASLENSNWTWSRNETLTTMFAMQNYFWEDRVVGLFGWRTDDQDLFDSTPNIEANTGAYRGFTRNGKLRDLTGDTFTRGVVVHVVPNLLSLYYNRANNFQDNGVAEVIGPIGNLTSIGNRSGEGEDMGVKLRFFDGKLSASLGWYETADTNQGSSIDGNFFTWSEGIWDALGTPVDLGGRDTRNLKSEGYEFELTANPTRQITLTFNAKDADTTVDNLFPWAQRYLDDNRAQWSANAGTPVATTTLPAGSTIGSSLAALDQLMAVITAPEGSAPFADRQRTANFFGRYAFDDDAVLPGFAVGFGLQYRGESLIAYRSQTDGAAVYSPDHLMANAMISYSRKLDYNRRLKLQLNIDNLFDLQDPQPVAGGEPTAAQLQTYQDLGLLYHGVVYTVQLPVPRRYSLTATLSF